MSEKRFVEDESYLVNYGNKCVCDMLKSKHLYLNEILDLLNSLNDENEQLKKKCDALQKKTEMDKNDFFISEAKRMTLLAFIKDKALQKEYFEWERRIYDE